MSHKLKVFLFTIVTITLFVTICWLFYEVEVKYMSPTPVPTDFADVPIGTKVDLGGFVPQNENKPVFLHFFNSHCQCSKFNVEKFAELLEQYKSEMNFYVILQGVSEEEVEAFNSKYELDVACLFDKDGEFSEKMGVYSTPQAVILNKEHVIYYKGNYNKARFCTSPKTAFAATALNTLIEGKPLPPFSEVASTPYGCSLPSNENN